MEPFTCHGSAGDGRWYTVWVWQDLIDHLEDPHGIISTGHPAYDLAAHERDHLQLDYPHTHQPDTTCRGYTLPEETS
jgi:hypothetical protein